jgi:hypothetical protein
MRISVVVPYAVSILIADFYAPKGIVDRLFELSAKPRLGIACSAEAIRYVNALRLANALRKEIGDCFPDIAAAHAGTEA